MKSLSLMILAGLISCSTANAATTTIGGTVAINVAGTFKTPIFNGNNFTNLGNNVSCKAIVSLVPNNVSAAFSSFTLGTLLNHLGEQSASAVGKVPVTAKATTFTCSATVNYRWENIDPATFKMAILYYVNASDPGGALVPCPPAPQQCIFKPTFPGKKLELIEAVTIPANGTTTTLKVTPRL